MSQSVPDRRPTSGEIERELERRQRIRRLWRGVLGAVGVLLTVSAVVVLVATFVFPTLRIYGNSMAPTMQEGEVVVAHKAQDYRTGDVVAFYYNNKILVKRVICGPGDWFNMQENGAVLVNGIMLDEPYVGQKSFGNCDLKLPYQVPEGHYFVMGDERVSSLDSRVAQVGCVPTEQIVGSIFLRVWPPGRLGLVS